MQIDCPIEALTKTQCFWNTDPTSRSHLFISLSVFLSAHKALALKDCLHIAALRGVYTSVYSQPSEMWGRPKLRREDTRIHKVCHLVCLQLICTFFYLHLSVCATCHKSNIIKPLAQLSFTIRFQPGVSNVKFTSYLCFFVLRAAVTHLGSIRG